MKYELISPVESKYSVVEQVLLNRGITKENLTHYLYTSDLDIYDFNLLDNLEKGAKMLISHIAQNDKILI